jgi:hypothetical protein
MSEDLIPDDEREVILDDEDTPEADPREWWDYDWPAPSGVAR